MSGARACALLLAAAVVGCSTTTTESKPLTLSVTANRTTAARGDTVAFVADASGTNLVGLLITYGDNTEDAYSTGGATTARVTFRHAYSTAGTFVARVVVTDALAGQKDATAEVRIN